MEQELRDLSREWWEKLRPLRRKFSRETILGGYDQNDLEQECYLLLLEALKKFDKSLGIPFERYYKTYLHGWRANQNRKCQRRQVVLADDEDLLDIEDERTNIMREVESDILFHQILECMTELKELEQQLIISYYLQNKKLSQVAIELGLTYRAAEYRKEEVLKKIRKKLSINQTGK